MTIAALRSAVRQTRPRPAEVARCHSARGRGYHPEVTRLRIGLGQLAPGLGLLEANLAEHRRTIEEAAGQGVNLLAFPELGLTGYLLQDLNSEVAMRADDAATDRPRPGRARDERHRWLRRGIGQLAALHLGGAAGAGRGAPRLSQVLPAELRPVRRATLLRRGRPDRRRRLAARRSPRASASARTSGTCRRPTCSPSTAPRCWSTSPRRRAATLPLPVEGGLGSAESWTDADADVRPADDVASWSSSIASASRNRSRSGVDRRSSIRAARSLFVAPLSRRRAVHDGHRPRRGSSRAGGAAAAARRAARVRAAAARAPRPRARRAVATRVSTRDRRRRAHAGCGPPYGCPTELLIDTDVADGSSASSSAATCARPASSGVLVGLSGGLDSALVAYLAVEAIGAREPALRADAVSDVGGRIACRCGGDRRRAGLRESAGRHLADRRRLFRGCAATAPRSTAAGAATSRRGRGWPSLYDLSVEWRGLVIGTGNKTEALLGYTTIFGDNAAAIQPIGDLYKSQVRQLAQAMGVPSQMLAKPPTADLWPGQTDEGELGITLRRGGPAAVLDGRPAPHSREQLVALGFDGRHDRSSPGAGRRLRVQAPDAAGGQADDPHAGRRLPVSASASATAPMAEVDESPGAGGTLYVVATPIGNLGDITLRALEVLRSVPLVAAEDTRLTRRLWARYEIDTRLVSYHAPDPAAAPRRSCSTTFAPETTWPW